MLSGLSDIIGIYFRGGRYVFRSQFFPAVDDHGFLSFPVCQTEKIHGELMGCLFFREHIPRD